MTDAAAVDLLGQPARQGQFDTPLVDVVAAQVLPSGKGLVDEAKVQSVLDPGPQLITELEEMLNEDAMVAVSRTAAIIAAAVGGDLPSEEEFDGLSVREVQELIPWLLASASPARPEFWDYLSRRITLKHLEAIAPSLAGADLSPLCAAGWNHWWASRGSLSGAELMEDGSPRPAGWFMNGKVLAYASAGDATFRFASYGQALRERGSASSATWEAGRGNLAGATLQRIVLRGIARSIRIGAEESPNIVDDVEAVLSTVQDQYYVDDIELRYGLADEDRRVRVSLGDQIAHNLGKSTIRDLLTALAGPAAYRKPVDIQPLSDGGGTSHS